MPVVGKCLNPKNSGNTEFRWEDLSPGVRYTVQVRGRYGSKDWGDWSEAAAIVVAESTSKKSNDNPGKGDQESDNQERSHTGRQTFNLGDITGRSRVRSTHTRTLHNAGDLLEFTFSLSQPRTVVFEVRNLQGTAIGAIAEVRGGSSRKSEGAITSAHPTTSQQSCSWRRFQQATTTC